MFGEEPDWEKNIDLLDLGFRLEISTPTLVKQLLAENSNKKVGNKDSLIDDEQRKENG